MKKGNEYDLHIDRTEFPGYGISDYEGIKVYIKNAVPGQKVRARITKKKKRICRSKNIRGASNCRGRNCTRLPAL